MRKYYWHWFGIKLKIHVQSDQQTDIKRQSQVEWLIHQSVKNGMSCHLLFFCTAVAAKRKKWLVMSAIVRVADPRMFSPILRVILCKQYKFTHCSGIILLQVPQYVLTEVIHLSNLDEMSNQQIITHYQVISLGIIVLRIIPQTENMMIIKYLLHVIFSVVYQWHILLSSNNV